MCENLVVVIDGFSMRCVCTVLSDRPGPEVLQSAQDQLTLTTHYTSHHYKVCVLAYQT